MSEEVIPMVFKVRELREKAGLSQEELSEKSGVSRTIISGLESGKIKNSTVITLKKIADALGVQIADLFLK